MKSPSISDDICRSVTWKDLTSATWNDLFAMLPGMILAISIRLLRS